MKRYLILGLLMLGLAHPVFGASELIQRAREQRAKLVTLQDELLEMLLDIPFDLRQYIFPMISEEVAIPKKIKTHPDIKVWKGKRPTRIAKRFQNDNEILEYLPARFYAFLAPEIWPDSENSNAEYNTNQLFSTLMSGQSSILPPEELVVIKNALKKLKSTLHPEQIQQLTEGNNQLLGKINPIQPEFTDYLRAYGYQSYNEFADFVDRIALTYRQYLSHQVVEPSEEQNIVANYFAMIPYIFKEDGFEMLLDPTRYSN